MNVRLHEKRQRVWALSSTSEDILSPCREQINSNQIKGSKEGTTKRTVIGLMVAVLIMLPAISVADKSNGEKGEHKAKMSKMHTNMGEMANIMSKMSQMMNKGKMTPEQKKKCADIMRQMSQMMKEMSVPHGKQVEEKHHRELKEMEGEINPLFDHLVQPG